MTSRISLRGNRSLFRTVDRLLRRYHGLLGWLLVAVAVIGTVLLGTIGLEKNLAANAPGESYSLTTRIFMAFQMLTLNEGGTAEPVSWELDVARLLALFAFSAAVLKTAASIFHKQFSEIALRFLSEHTVICGAGQKGILLAQELIGHGEKIVVIDTRNDLAEFDELREMGAYEVSGNAANSNVLMRAGVQRAKRMILVSGTDAMNVQIAVIAREMCFQHRSADRQRLTIHVHCTDPRIFSLLQPDRNESDRQTVVRDECRRFDITLNAARVLLETHPPDYETIDEKSNLTVQILLLGFSVESQAVLLQVAKLAHYANQKKPRVVIFAQQAIVHLQRLRFRYPQIDNIVEIVSIDRDLDHVDTMCDVQRFSESPDTLTTIVIANADEELSLQIALALPRMINYARIPVLIRLNHREQFSEFLRSDPRHEWWCAFGSVADAGNSTMVIAGQLDDAAKVIHADYVRRKTEAGDDPSMFPAMLPWDQLSESYREANRHQADHISVKLRAVQCVSISTSEVVSKPEANWSNEEIEILARMEHQRWNANRWLEGWQYGPRDDSQKLHPNLVPWEGLDEATRDYDRNAVRQIPELLRLTQRVIVRA